MPRTYHLKKNNEYYMPHDIQGYDRLKHVKRDGQIFFAGLSLGFLLFVTTLFIEEVFVKK